MPTMVRQLRYNLHIDLSETCLAGGTVAVVVVAADAVADDRDDVVLENQDQEQDQDQEDQEPSSHWSWSSTLP